MLGGFLYVVDPWVPFAAAAVLVVDLGASPSGSSRCASPPRPQRVAVERRSNRPKERPSLHEAVEGLRFVRSQPILLGAISLDLFAVLFGGAVALLPAIAEDRLGVGAVGLGWLRAATGIGAGVGRVVPHAAPGESAHRPHLAARGRARSASAPSRSASPPASSMAFVALLVLSGADAVSVFIRSTLVPLVTPADKRGRVLAVEAVFIGASNELGAFESGVVGQLLGPAVAIVLGGVGDPRRRRPLVGHLPGPAVGRRLPRGPRPHPPATSPAAAGPAVTMGRAPSSHYDANGARP